jgi:1,4-dihydroxy-2-naphthoate octaprenyltransferase
MCMPRLSVILRELRAEFLPASVVPVLLGAAIVHTRTGAFDGFLFALTLIGVALIHLASNVANDYFDHLSGNDILNTQFVRPFTGGSRLIQEKLIAPRAVLALSLVLAAAAIAVGAVLTALRGPYIVLLGAVGILGGFFYVAPPIYFAKRGLGEIVIGLNFGILTVIGTYFVQTRTVTAESFVASLPLAGFIAAVVFINEFQDMNADARVGKRTLVVRMGLHRAARFYGVLVLACYAPIVAGVASGLMPSTALLGLGTAPLALKAFLTALKRYGSPRELAPANALTVASHALTGILMTIGYLLAR